MAINANHPFEELNGVRCAVVEKNCSPERVKFLTYILEGNGYALIVAASPPPKAAKPAAAPVAPTAPAAESVPAATPAPAAASANAAESTPAAEPAVPAPPPPPESFTVGVTDVTFNVTNAIYGRLLRSPDGRVVTMDFWQQRTDVSRDDVPYYAGSPV